MNLFKKIYTAQYRTQRWLLVKYYGLRQSPKNEVAPDFAPKKILIVLMGLLGDSVMNVPAIAATRNAWKDAHITLLCKNHHRELLAACPYINDFHVFQTDPMSWRSRNETQKLRRWLRESNFDLALILLGDQFAHLLAEANIPIRVGVAGDVFEPYLTHSYNIGSPRTWGIDERLNALRALGYRADSSLPELWVEESARKSARAKLLSLELGENEQYCVLHPFGSTPLQWWNVQDVKPLARLLYEKHRIKTVLVGKKYDLNGVTVDPTVTEQIDSTVINTTGKLSLPELLAIIADAQLVITTDSGPFHIAGALKKPTIGLFRARRPEHARHYPTAETIFGLNESCQKHCRWDYCQANPCKQLFNITVEDVFKKADGRLSSIPK